MDRKEREEFKCLKVRYVEEFDGEGIGYGSCVGRIDRVVSGEGGN